MSAGSSRAFKVPKKSFVAVHSQTLSWSWNELYSIFCQLNDLKLHDWQLTRWLCSIFFFRWTEFFRKNFQAKSSVREGEPVHGVCLKKKLGKVSSNLLQVFYGIGFHLYAWSSPDYLDKVLFLFTQKTVLSSEINLSVKSSENSKDNPLWSNSHD